MADDVANSLADLLRDGSCSPCARPPGFLAIRWAAAIRKWPLPQAGSQTFRFLIAASGSGWLAASVENRVEGGVEQAFRPGLAGV